MEQAKKKRKALLKFHLRLSLEHVVCSPLREFPISLSPTNKHNGEEKSPLDFVSDINKFGL